MKATVMAVVLAVAGVCPAWAQQACDVRPNIAVSGDAAVTVKPDKIVVTLGVETWDADITAAKRKNNEIVRKTMAAVRECGIPAKEVQTDYLMLEPRYHDNYTKEEFVGYFARQNLVVTLTETDKIETLITGVLNAGVNYILGIDFQVTEFKKYREQAREMALKAAKEKAEKMAGVLGQSLGAPVQISEGYSRSSGWDCRGWGYGRGQGMFQNTVQNAQSGTNDLPVSDTVAPGKISIEASVNVSFELKGRK